MTHVLTTLKPRTWLLLVGLFVVGGALLLPDIAFADDSFGDTLLKKFLYTVIVNLTGWMLWLGGMLLDYGVNTFVINFGLNFNSNGVGVAVNQLWVVVRDFFNILFIFGLVYVGFKMIWDTDDSRTKSTLVSLIIAALLVNFSLFITKFVVDFSNTLASEVAIAGFESGETGIDSNGKKVDIGDTFFGLMGISTILQTTPELNEGQVAPYSFIFGIGIINIIGAFAFGVGGIMLIIRFVVLSIYMVLSPFMFLGMVFPGLQSMSRKYWDGFFKQAFYAPVYIVMIFFAATILNNFFKGGGSMEGAGVGDLTGTNSVFVNQTGGNIAEFGGGLAPFILSAAFLIAAVQVAGKLASDGSGAMAKVTGGVNARVRGAVRRPLNMYGGAARGMGRGAVRGVGGVGARALNAGAETRRRQLNAYTANLSQKGWVGKATARTLDRTAGAGFDKLAGAQVLGSETAKQMRERIAKQQDSFNKEHGAIIRTEKGSEQLKKANRNTDVNDAKQRENRIDAINALAASVPKMSDEEVLMQTKEVLMDPAFAQHLKDSHIKAIKESGQYTNEEAKEISDKRDFAAVETISETLDSTNASAEELNKALDQLSQTVQRMPTERLQSLGIDKLKNQRVAMNLTSKQIEDLQNSGRYTATEMAAIKSAKDTATIAIASGIAPDISNVTNSEQSVALSERRGKLFKGNAQEVGKLPAQVFVNPAMAEYITPAALQQRVRNGISEKEVTAIEKNIGNYAMGLGSSREAGMWENWSKNTTEGARFDF